STDRSPAWGCHGTPAPGSPGSKQIHHGLAGRRGPVLDFVSASHGGSADQRRGWVCALLHG
ncbi:MAG: hypothetical protein AAF235_08620, partial [Planctomycetota bacterium]